MSAESVVQFRVRYSETDQMGTYSNSSALDWFECGRTEFFRQTGTSYAEMEDRGVLLPVTDDAAVNQEAQALVDAALEKAAGTNENVGNGKRER